MITALLITAGALWLLGRKRNGVSGIGSTKRQTRRIWREVEAAQRAGVNLDDPDGWQQSAPVLRNMAKGRLSASASDKPDEQRYFNQLRRAYKSIAGTGLPYDESVVRNAYGDTILVYRDYHLDELPKTAAEWMLNEAQSNLSNPEQAAYWITIADIASGRVKFVWASDGVHRGVQQLIFGSNAPAERKQRISYLASTMKGGRYPEEYAHYLWESVFNGAADDQEITDGVLEALRTCTSVGQAQEICIDEYMRAHHPSEQPMWSDVPF